MSGLTDAEKAFATRMQFHVERGLAFAEAAQAVVNDDARLFTAFWDRGSSHYLPTPDERGRSYNTGTRPGDVIVSEISQHVHRALLTTPDSNAGMSSQESGA